VVQALLLYVGIGNERKKIVGRVLRKEREGRNGVEICCVDAW
jgi:hypothetical protein